MSTPDGGTPGFGSGEGGAGESKTGRLEAFSDGVLAVIITIMALELKAPAGHGFAALGERVPALLVYVLSFTFIGIYWNNHHHLLRAARRVTPAVMWANLHLLFWLSLTPFVTSWVGQTCFAAWPVAAYGAVFLMAGVAHYLLTRTLIAHHGSDSPLALAVGRDWKGKLSPILYIVGIIVTLRYSWIAQAIFVIGALIWLIPDRRIEKRLVS